MLLGGCLAGRAARYAKDTCIQDSLLRRFLSSWKYGPCSWHLHLRKYREVETQRQAHGLNRSIREIDRLYTGCLAQFPCFRSATTLNQNRPRESLFSEVGNVLDTSLLRFKVQPLHQRNQARIRMALYKTWISRCDETSIRRVDQSRKAKYGRVPRHAARSAGEPIEAIDLLNLNELVACPS